MPVADVAVPGADGVVAVAGRADPYADARSLPFRLRRRRFAHVQRLIEAVLAEKASCRIIDIGGTERYWDIAGDFLAGKAVEIHLVNLEAVPVAHARFRSLAGDATRLGDIADSAFDLVHSNSVIEHVGGWERMTAMAANVRRLAPRYYLQTPNFWFPVEPHFRSLGFHWLPESLRARALMRRSKGFRARQTTLDGAMRQVESVRLLDRRQLAALFPDATILDERIGPFSKSLMAVRG
jgi:hypothetical protein